MAYIHQKDIFSCLNEVLDYTLAEIGGILTDQDLVHVAVPDSRLSEVKNGKRKGYSDLAEKTDQIYDAFFLPKTKGLQDQSGILHKLIQYVKKSGLEFDRSDGCENDTFESYTKRMLSCGLPNYEKPTQGPDSTRARTATFSAPALRTQNFFTTEQFIGRQNLIDDISNLLLQRHFAVLSGLGGIGKTYLASEYARLHQNSYGHIQCVFCSGDTASFRQMLLQLRFDHLDEMEWSEEEKLRQRLRILKNNDTPDLLILDNVDQPLEDMQLCNELLRDSQLHIIITTRLADFFSSAATIPVSALKWEEQLKLFELHFGAPVAEADKPVVAQILQQIGGHTLLIELVAKSIDKGEIPYEKMLAHLRGDAAPGSLPKVPVRKDDRDQLDELWHFVKTILFSIEPLSPEQRSALRLLTLLPTDGISRSLFFQLAPDQKNAVTQLEGRSWCIKEKKDSKNMIRLHPVIREVIRQELSPSCATCGSFLDALCALLESENSQDWTDDLCRLIPAIANTISFDREQPSADLFRYLQTMGDFCRSRYLYTQALVLCQSALSVWERGKELFDREIPYRLYMQTGKLFQRLARYSDAERCFTSSLDFTEENSVERAQSYRNLGEVTRKASRYQQALDYDQRALRMFTDKEDIAEVTNAIGVVYLNMGDAAEDSEERQQYQELAKRNYLDALHLWEQCEVPPRQLAFSNHNIGTVFHRLGEYDSAVTYHQKGLQLRQDNNLEETDISASFVWLGKDYTALGNFKKAKDYIDRSLNIRRRILGEDHPDFAWSLDSLSEWYEKTGDLHKAIETMDRVIAIRTAALGLEHQYTKQAIGRRNALLAL